MLEYMLHAIARQSNTLWVTLLHMAVEATKNSITDALMGGLRSRQCTCRLVSSVAIRMRSLLKELGHDRNRLSLHL